jgi:hypothetical protein
VFCRPVTLFVNCITETNHLRPARYPALIYGIHIFISVATIVYFYHFIYKLDLLILYRGADKSLARPTSQCILFDGENTSFDAIIYIYIYKQY